MQRHQHERSNMFNVRFIHLFHVGLGGLLRGKQGKTAQPTQVRELTVCLHRSPRGHCCKHIMDPVLKGL